jgi:uncharacterized membrane protein
VTAPVVTVRSASAADGQSAPEHAATPTWPAVERRRRPRRELYIDAFRGVMALVMVQGHVFDALLRPELVLSPLYQFQLVFHGSTAPGFLFASGFVAGLPRAPLSLKASLRRARRLLFVLAVGYVLHLPYLSFWKTVLQSTPAEKAALFACDALQVIALSQLFVLVLQWLAGRRWVHLAAALGLVVLALGPWVWTSGVSKRLPLWLGAYVDMAVAPSHFPVFPFAAFVLAGTVAGAALGRQDATRRRRRSWVFAALLIGSGLLLAGILRDRVDFWSISPAYALLRLGGLLVLMRAVERAATREWPGVRALALLGHETLLVFVLHLVLLFGGVLGPGPLTAHLGQLGFGGALLVLLLMLPVLLAAAWAWHQLKVRAPHEARLVLVFLATAFTYEFLTRPW